MKLKARLDMKYQIIYLITIELEIDFYEQADNDTIANSTRVQVHERSEREKYKDVTFNNNLDQSKQIAVLGFNNPNVVQTALDGIGKNIELMYGDRGEEFVKGKNKKYTILSVKAL